MTGYICLIIFDIYIHFNFELALIYLKADTTNCDSLLTDWLTHWHTDWRLSIAQCTRWKVSYWETRSLNWWLTIGLDDDLALNRWQVIIYVPYDKIYIWHKQQWYRPAAEQLTVSVSRQHIDVNHGACAQHVNPAFTLRLLSSLLSTDPLFTHTGWQLLHIQPI